MTAAQSRRLVDVFPDLAAEIIALLRADGDTTLASVVDGLLYYGPCTCSPTCANLLTAPAGSSGAAVGPAGT
jgi:hypothetical protein